MWLVSRSAVEMLRKAMSFCGGFIVNLSPSASLPMIIRQIRWLIGSSRPPGGSPPPSTPTLSNGEEDEQTSRKQERFVEGASERLEGAFIADSRTAAAQSALDASYAQPASPAGSGAGKQLDVEKLHLRDDAAATLRAEHPRISWSDQSKGVTQMSKLYTAEMVEAIALRAYASQIFESPNYVEPRFRTRVLQEIKRYGLPQGSPRSYQRKKGRFRS